MAYNRGDGLFGLVGALADEAKWFTDQRAPYPIERNVRAALSSPFEERPVPQALLDGARGVGRAVLDDEVDSTEPRRRSPRPRRREMSQAHERRISDDMAALRNEVRALGEAVDRLVRDHDG
jgi:hypothetical protein